MDIHNIDDFLNLQDQNEINLLSAEGIAPIQHNESEWHSVTSTPSDSFPTANNILYGTEDCNDNNHNSSNEPSNNNSNNWGFELGFNFMHDNNNNVDANNFITPDSLLKQPQIQQQQQQPSEQRVTRSRSITLNTTPTVTYKKKKSRAKKLYCICQQPYNGKPMVQCDRCEEWFHCACVSFDPDAEEEDIDWICQKCEQETQQTPASDNNDNNDNNDEVAPNDNTRQTRSRQQSTCLYKGCNNHTRADSYCSDVCARKDEQGTPAVRRNTKKKETPPPPPPPEESEKEEPQESSTPNSPSQMTADENPVRRNVIKNMTGILKTIMESAVQKDPELFNVGEIPERAESLARSIENTMLEQLGDTKGRQRTCGEPYKNKFRSLLHNLKDKANQTFQLRVVAGDLTPLELIKMSSEDMANPELRSMSEVLRQKSLKNSILKIENVPIIKKTHKGDIIMIPSKEEKNQDDFYKEPLLENKNSSSNQQEIPVSDTADHTSTKSAEPMDDILARIGVANQEDQRRDPSNLNTGHRAKKRKVTVDVETLLGEEEETPFVVEEVDTTELENQEESDQKDQTEEPEAMEQDEEEGEIPSIWQGKVNMPQVAEFEACARQVGGRQLNAEEWKEVLSPTMWIEGRIPSDRVTNYITQTQYSSSREIVLIQVEAQNRQAEPSLNEGQAQTLLNYLQTRQRYAVVGHNKTKIKDFYLIPLQKVQQIPDWLYVVRVEETKRDADLFLGVLVLQRTKQQQQQQQQPVSFHYPSY